MEVVEHGCAGCQSRELYIVDLEVSTVHFGRFLGSHIAMDSTADVDCNRCYLQDSTETDDRTTLAWVAALSTFMVDESPTINAVALACLFAWSTSRFALVTSLHGVLVIVLLESRHAESQRKDVMIAPPTRTFPINCRNNEILHLASRKDLQDGNIFRVSSER